MNLLVLPNASQELLAYVVATCFPKIHTRLNHRSVSMPYLTSLRQAKIFEFKELSPHEPIRESQRRKDKTLLSLLPDLGLSTKLPKLTEQATRAAAGDEPHALYNKDTYWEFHILLIELLGSFQQAVEGLSKSRGSLVEPEAGSPEFLQHLDKATFHGSILQAIVQGSGISQHLKRLAPSLGDHRRPELVNSTMTKGEGEAMDSTMTDEQREDQDMELLQIRPGVIGEDGRVQSVWKSYLDWLGLILAHYNAVQTLVRFVKGPYFHTKSISIKILTSPNVGTRKLDWKTVLNNSKFFPYHSGDLSIKAIFDFLEDGIASHPEVTMTHIKDFRQAFIQFTSKTLSLGDLSVPLKRLESQIGHARWGEYIGQICSNVAKLEQSPNDPESISRITTATGLLLDDVNIFKLFRDINTKGFTGSLHCEATLASLFMLPPLPRLEVT